MRTHYPRTAHLPWSPGASADDLRAGDLSGFAGLEVVVTEKLDGENTTLYRDGLHARSLDSAHHPSRAWVKALQGRIAHAIPPGRRVCGENLYARHSIRYDDLDSWFSAFSVWDGEHCLGWDDTVRFARRLGVPTPPVLWRGVFDERALRALRLDTERQEGYVVRTVAGFGRAEFARRVAKWVRPAHVRTGTHWMHAAVVPNGLGPRAALWDAASGGPADPAALLAALDLDPQDAARPPRTGTAAGTAAAAVAEVTGRLDALGRCGAARLAGVLAALLHGGRRAALAPALVAPLGLPLARRVADLVGLHRALHRPYPDQDRRAGLVRLSYAADLGVLHAVALAATAGRTDPQAGEDREQVEWSELHAQEAGLLGEAPLAPLRTGLRAALDGLPAAAADRCWAEAREGFALGRISTVEEAAARGWRWRTGDFPRLVLTVGPAGSGKSTFARALPGVDETVSLDDLRAARGCRSDQRANPELLRAALARLDEALTGRRTVVWDATSLNQQQRSLVHAVAARRDALTTHAVLLVTGAELARRNAHREHPVPPPVLAAQLGRLGQPYPGQAHRTWYVGPDGAVGDRDGTLEDEEF
ncbi:RNA ligase family protein [Kitasatospora sp. NPDC094015]|uniref:RNA ligase family protein n=1 Tax=Kitasatospora sp. NPDC094015 TaxID=3155205 RepID=UPI0033289BD4